MRGIEGHRLPAKARNALPNKDFLFPKERKDPVEDKRHIEAAKMLVGKTKGVSAAEMKRAKARLKGL